MTDQPDVEMFDRAGGPRLAVRRREGRGPTLLFLPGYASDMDGSKALALDAFAAARGLAMLRFDYSGTGLSEGAFSDGTLEGWIDEAKAVAASCEGPLVLAGSSMGGWIALHLALRLPDRVRALVGIAAAPDFTRWGFTDEQKASLAKDGRLEEPNPYGEEPFVTHRGFWESGDPLCLLDSEIGIDCPVRLVHGDRDSDVPLEVAFMLKDRLRSADVQIEVLKGCGHRLSEPNAIQAILQAVLPFVETDARC